MNIIPLQSGLNLGTVWVTGASEGIGRAACLLLARSGWRVAASARNAGRLEELKRLHASIETFPFDVADPAQREEVYRAVRNKLGPIDALVNNAGYGIRGAVEEFSSAENRDIFDTNVFAPLALTRLVVPEMRERREGRIVMVTSLAGRVAAPLSGAYSATKFALRGYSDAMRIELGPYGVKIIQVEPGPIRTSFGAVARGMSLERLRNSYSPYFTWYRNFLEKGYYDPRVYFKPTHVARAICHACGSERPKAVYPVHPAAEWLPLLAAMLPAKWMDRLVGNRLGFNRKIPYDGDILRLR